MAVCLIKLYLLEIKECISFKPVCTFVLEDGKSTNHIFLL